MNKKIIVPVMVTALAVSSVPVNYSINRAGSCNIVKAENKDGMVIENGILKRYEGDAANIVIPEGVTAIGEYAFEYKESVKNITLPDSVTKIDRYAFHGCKNLEKVEGGKIDTVSNVAFSLCGKLSSIDLSKAKEIGSAAFYGCKNLKTVKLDEVQSIGGGSFNCAGIETAELNFVGEDGIIQSSAFEECENLKKVTIKGALSEIGNTAFLKCKTLEDIQIEDSSNITYIGGRAFDQTPWLTKQLNQSGDKMLIINHILVKYLPNTFYAGEYAGIPYEELSEEQIRTRTDSDFTYTTPKNVKMETVTIPGEVRSIANNAFYGAYSVENVIFDSEIREIEIGEGAFDFTTWEIEYMKKEDYLVIAGNLVKAKYDKEVIEVPNGVKKVIPGAFMTRYASGKVPEEKIVRAKEVVFPKSVEEIEDWFFYPLVENTIWEPEKVIVPTVLKEKYYGGLSAGVIEFKDVSASLDAKDLIEGYKPGDITTSPAVPSPTASTTQSPSPVVTQTPSPTAAVTQTPNPTAAVTQTPNPTTAVTQTPKPTVAATQIPSPTVAATWTPSPTIPVTQTPSPTTAVTQTPKPTAVVTQTPSPTTAVTQTPSPTAAVTQTTNPTVPATQIPKPTTAVTQQPNPTKTPVSTPAPVVKVKRAVITKAKRLSNKRIKVYIKKTEKVKGYQVLISTDKKFRKNLKKVTTTSQSAVFKKLKKEKTYYIKVRAYKLNSNKKKIYGKYSVIRKVK